MSQPLTFSSHHSPVLGRRGMVATSQPLAVAVGLEILRQGGNAADAAVATAAALNVTEPTSTGIGGDCFALVYEAATGQVTALNGSGRAPAAFGLDDAQRLMARRVRSHQTVVLGGIYEQVTRDEVDKVPLLGDIPVLGYLFKRTLESDEKAELLIFVTPKILKDTLSL